MNSDSPIPAFNDPLPIDLFLESMDNAYLYDDLRQFEHYFLEYLTDENYDLDQPLGLWASSSDELVFLIAACWRLGIPFVPFDPELSGKELSKQLGQITVGAIISSRPNSTPDNSTNIIPINEFYLKKVLQPDFEPQEWVKTHKEKVQNEHIFGYFFTSGTAGKPKVVPLKRRQMLYAAEASSQNLKPRRNHFWLLCMPLHHVGGISLILRSLLYGSAIFRMDSFDATSTAEHLSNDHRFQAVSLVPTMLQRLLQIPDLQVHDNFQAILLGGGPISEAKVEECFQRGVPIIASYGMTESCAQIAANPLMTIGDLSRPKKSAGKVFEPNNIDIRNEDSQAVTVGRSGQIWLKGPQVFDGYWNQVPSSSFDKQGWFNTGDYGYLNRNNELFIEARRTDLIISGGENISPAEVEEALLRLDAVQEAAVIGLPDEEWGQKVVALVVPNPEGVFNVEHILDKLHGELRSFKIPKRIIPTDSITRTSTGKIQRRKIKKELLS